MLIDIQKVQNILSWIKEKIYLDSISEKAKNRRVKRGEIYKCNFGYGIGSEIQKERPCVIIQNDVRNINSSTVIVAPITHTAKNIPCMALVTTQYNEFDKILVDGYVNLSHIQTVSKSRLGDYISKLSVADMKKVNLAIYDAVGLMSEIKNYEKRLVSKLEYIEKIKNERNIALDNLNELYILTKTNNFEELKEYINNS